MPEVNKPIYALSVKQPWATLILCGIPYLKPVLCEDSKSTRLESTDQMIFKDVENRDWTIPEWFSLPKRIYIHIPKKDDDFETSLTWFCETFGGAYGLFILHFSTKIHRGVLAGEVDIIGCVTDSKYLWAIKE